ncbi:hypothetical protein Tco_1455365, partial [Tanacetum coccineum]
MTSHRVCGRCGDIDRKILHHIRLKGAFHHFCTTCVLHTHKQTFCPSCLTIHHHSPPQNAVVCYKCRSFSHSTCVTRHGSHLFSCFSCLNPGSLDFDMKIKEGRSGGFKGINGVSGKLLVLAAEISNVSMRNAVVAAHNDAVNRGKEAVYAWKMAREAVVRVENMKYDHRIVIAGNGNGNDNGNGNRNGRGVDTNVVSEALNAVNLAGEAVSNNLKSDEDDDYDGFAEQIESELLLDSEESPKNNCRWSIG